MIERGSVRPGDEVAVVGLGVDGTTARVAFVAVGRSAVGSAGAGTNAGLVLQGQVAGVLKDGQVLATPGSVVARSVFAADMALLPEESSPADVLSGDRLGFYVRTASVPGVVTLPHGLDALRPMHTAAVEIDLDEPVALAVGQRFAFRHRGRAAGSGTVTRILPGAR
ncbi:hypothetical protein [Kitasatospora sp. NPDC085879]|uniref:EF-Tu C-terminal domain-related protein n=1 Tax=Kitasatospora sp. NPDC085879 TaxID=3154769 RepID=UPI00343678C4